VARSIFVADTDAKAREYVTAENSPYRLYFGNLLTKLKMAGRAEAFKEDRSMPDDAVTPEYVVDKLAIYGSPESVVEQLLAFREEIGDFGTLLYAGKDWLDRDMGRRSMVLMAEKVLPKLNAAIGKG
jgi:alkanesulfonate monooxygenase SsuD/methylene tetrahydromethanopterin reductase-like flavin-dependent oxidoreductase (luciferase family)